MSNEIKRYTTKQTAKMIREALKTYFPGTKFSVRKEEYTGGSTINVRWVDGASEDSVARIVKYFEGATFDGMRDLKEYKKKTELNEKGEEIRVQYGVDWVHVNRRYSHNFVYQVAKYVIDEYSLDDLYLQKVKESYDGYYYWDVVHVFEPNVPFRGLTEAFRYYARQWDADKEGNIITETTK